MTLIRKNHEELKNIDWRKDSNRKKFEKCLQNHRDVKKRWDYLRKFGWLTGIIIIPFLTICTFYGGIAYEVVKQERQRKDIEENILKLNWMSENNIQNISTYKGEIPKFEYYRFQNYMLMNYYPYLTGLCQGGAFLCCVGYHIAPYQWFNPLGLTLGIVNQSLKVFISIININFGLRDEL